MSFVWIMVKVPIWCSWNGLFTTILVFPFSQFKKTSSYYFELAQANPFSTFCLFWSKPVNICLSWLALSSTFLLQLSYIFMQGLVFPANKCTLSYSVFRYLFFWPFLLYFLSGIWFTNTKFTLILIVGLLRCLLNLLYMIYIKVVLLVA